MIELITFQRAIDLSGSSKKHLLLGNGFSIAFRKDIFSYATLFQQADFTGCPNAQKVFSYLQTEDFESVIEILEKSTFVIPAYSDSLKDMVHSIELDAKSLKHLLVNTLAKNHPSRPNEITDLQYLACRRFLSNFIDKKTVNPGHIYSLNYDLLLYWTLMHTEDNDAYEFEIDDDFNRDFLGFSQIDGEAEFAPDVTWQGETQAHSQNIHFLHGALHLYDEGFQLKKYTWKDSGIALIDQSRYSIDNGFFPLFVTEGNAEKKIDKILHSAYLHKGYRSFVSNTLQKTGSFYTFGFSFSDNDIHIYEKLSEGKFPKLFVGIYGDLKTEQNQKIIQKTSSWQTKRSSKYPLEIYYYSAESAKVWGE
jgi:hypothetical protein